MVSIQEKELAESCRALSETYGVKTHRLLLDLSRDDAPQKTAAFVDGEGLEIDILINNAGIFSFNTLADTHKRKIDCFIDLHVRAVTGLSLLFAERMARRGHGYILNMSSMSCWMPMPGIAMYSATKAYIRVFTRALHYEMRDCGVGVTVACPGGIATDLFGLPEPLKRLAVSIRVLDTPEAFARKAIVKMLKKKRQLHQRLAQPLLHLPHRRDAHSGPYAHQAAYARPWHPPPLTPSLQPRACRAVSVFFAKTVHKMPQENVMLVRL